MARCAITVVALLGLAGAAACVSEPTVHLRLVEWGRYREPTDFITRPTDSQHVYIAEKAGRVIEVSRDGTKRRTVLDLRRRVVNDGEQGLLSIAWNLDGTMLYVHYSKAPDGNTHISSFARTASGNLGAERSVLVVKQPASNHNGGTIRFDASGNLLIALGDGGGAGDTGDGHVRGGNAQSKHSLLGKILRITPTADARVPYRATEGNPFIGRPGKDEIFALGLRNPYRFDLDARTKMLWIADVGQGDYEEIDRIAYESAAGANFGWARREGAHAFGTNTGSKDHRFREPVVEQSHADGNCAIIGGLVARDPSVPSLRGAYVFADFCTGVIEAVAASGTQFLRVRTNLRIDSPTGFGRDSHGRTYVMSQDGVISRITE